jgi:hypothetical protein
MPAMTIPFNTLRKKWMADPEFRKAYDAISFETSSTSSDARKLRPAGTTPRRSTRKV